MPAVHHLKALAHHAIKAYGHHSSSPLPHQPLSPLSSSTHSRCALPPPFVTSHPPVEVLCSTLVAVRSLTALGTMRRRPSSSHAGTLEQTRWLSLLLANVAKSHHHHDVVPHLTTTTSSSATTTSPYTDHPAGLHASPHPDVSTAAPPSRPRHCHPCLRSSSSR